MQRQELTAGDVLSRHYHCSQNTQILLNSKEQIHVLLLEISGHQEYTNANKKKWEALESKNI